MSERLCANEACVCHPVRSRIFCCSICAAATLKALEPSVDCSCGHVECASARSEAWTPVLDTVR